MESDQLYNEIVSFCQANSDEATVLKYARYFKEGYDAYGVPTAAYLEKVSELKALETISLQDILACAHRLLKSGKYEETSFVISLIEGYKKKFDAQTFTAIEKWFESGISNWAHTDFLSGNVLPYFFLKKIIPLEKLNSWRTSPYKFQRRCVPVTLIKLLKTTSDLNVLFEMINPMMMDNERVVHQGLGWFLREAWKLKHEETEDFLFRWKDDSARLIFQYATEKMGKTERVRFKKTRI